MGSQSGVRGIALGRLDTTGQWLEGGVVAGAIGRSTPRRRFAVRSAALHAPHGVLLVSK